MKCDLNIFSVVPKKLIAPAVMTTLISLPMASQSRNLIKEDVFEKSNIKSEQVDKTHQNMKNDSDSVS